MHAAHGRQAQTYRQLSLSAQPRIAGLAVQIGRRRGTAQHVAQTLRRRIVLCAVRRLRLVIRIVDARAAQRAVHHQQRVLHGQKLHQAVHAVGRVLVLLLKLELEGVLPDGLFILAQTQTHFIAEEERLCVAALARLEAAQRVLAVLEADVRLAALAEGLAAVLAQLLAREVWAWRQHKRLRPLAQLAQLLGLLLLDGLVHLLLEAGALQLVQLDAALHALLLLQASHRHLQQALVALVLAHRVRQAVLEHRRLVGRVPAENVAFGHGQQHQRQPRVLHLFEADLAAAVRR